MNAAHVLQKASKYAGLDDDQVVPAVLDHPGMEQAMRRFNEDMKAACAEIANREQAARDAFEMTVGDRFE